MDPILIIGIDIIRTQMNEVVWCTLPGDKTKNRIRCMNLN